MWNLEKIVQMNYLQGQNRDTDVKNQSVDMEDEVGEGGRRGVMNWEIVIDIYIIMCKAASGNLPHSTGSSA